LQAAFARIEQTQVAFAAQLKNCCKNATELGLLIQEKVAAALAMVGCLYLETAILTLIVFQILHA
jgi:hypothetical protein